MMPKEYIERETAMPEGFCVGVSCQECPFCDDPIKGGCKVARFIDAIPAADVVEVVRCRECKYRAEDDFCIGRGWPDKLVADDGFCEKGKRKDGEQDDV